MCLLLMSVRAWMMDNVGLNLELILCDVDRNDGVGLVGGDGFLKENPVFLP